MWAITAYVKADIGSSTRLPTPFARSAGRARQLRRLQRYLNWFGTAEMVDASP